MPAVPLVGNLASAIVPEVIAAVSIAIAVFVIKLTLPFAANVITGTIVALPYTPAVAEIFVASVLALSKACCARTFAEFACVKAAAILAFCVVSVAVAALAAAKAELA